MFCVVHLWLHHFLFQSKLDKDITDGWREKWMNNFNHDYGLNPWYIHVPSSHTAKNEYDMIYDILDMCLIMI